MKTIQTIAATFLVVLLGASTVIAQTVPVSGHAVYIPGSSKSVALPDGRTLVHNTMHSVLIEDEPENPQHLASQDCAGTDLLAEDGTVLQIGGACAAVDADGDLIRISYLNKPTGGVWRYAGGTGKYEGVEGGGTSEVVAVGPDGRVTLRYEGEMILAAQPE